MRKYFGVRNIVSQVVLHILGKRGFYVFDHRHIAEQPDILERSAHPLGYDDRCVFIPVIRLPIR